MKRVRFPRKKEILKMREVTTFRVSSKNPRRVFVDGESKYTIERKLLDAFRIHLFSRRIQRKAPGLNIQKVLRQRGRILAQNFLEGNPINEKELTSSQVNDLARLLAQLHSIRKPFWARIPRICRIETRPDYLIGNISEAGFLTPREANQLHAFFDKKVRADKVICHGDVNKGNVVQASDKLGVIDLGGLSLGYRELELSKSMFHLSLNGEQRENFLRAYKDAGGNLTNFNENPFFWRALGVLEKLWSSAREYARADNTITKQEQFARAEKRKRALFEIVSSAIK